MPDTLHLLDQRSGIVRVSVRVGAVVPDAVWRQALERALAALEMPGIVGVLGPADVRGTFLQELMAGLRERGWAVTFVPRTDLEKPPAVAGGALLIEDAARMDAAILEEICRAPGRRVVLAGLSAFTLVELPTPLTVVTFEFAPLVHLEPLSPEIAGAPRSPRSNAGVAIASGVLAVTGLVVALLWTMARQEPARFASKQPGDVTGAISPAPRPAAAEARLGIGTSREPAVPVVAQTEPQSGSERAPPPAPPQLQAGPSPAPGSRQALNVAPAAAIAPPPLSEAPRATPREPAALSESAPQLLPDNAPIRVQVSYAPRSATAKQEATGVVQLLRGGGLAASDPAPAARAAGKAAITYFFAEDRDGATRVEHDLGEGFGPARLSPAAPGQPLPRPGIIAVLVPER